ncbi:MAG: hypothetical protein BWY29_00237 [Microgenomates group bacterium ADurb.Bin238]|nr:MAG: hypothetical protein BWY29_00237 [Microgenomates group bacterium ADurb.Bin238]
MPTATMIKMRQGMEEDESWPSSGVAWSRA